MHQTQQRLWDEHGLPCCSSAMTVRTSVAAAVAIDEMAGTQRYDVLCFIRENAGKGVTRQEIAVALELTLQSVCGRVGELIGQGFVWQGKETRDRQKVLRPRRA